MAEQFGLSIILKMIDDVTAPLRKVGGAFDEINKKYNEVGKGMRGVGKKLTYGLTLPIMGLGGLAVNESRKLENGFLAMQNSMNEPIEVLKKLEKEFINMSSVTSHAADDLMRMAAVGSDLGIPTKDLKDFAKFAMDLSIATDIIGDEGIRNFNALANVIGVTHKEYRKLGATINDVGGTANAKLAETTRLIGGAGKAAGMSTPQMVGLAAWINRVGDESGTVMSKLISDMQEAVDFQDATGAKLEFFARRAGMEGKEMLFRKLWKEDPTKAIALFINGIKKMGEDGGNAKKELEALGFSGTKMTTLFKNLAENFDIYTEAQKKAAKSWEDGNSVTIEAERIYKSYDGTLKQLRNTLGILLGQFSEVLLPALKGIVAILQPLVELFKDLPYSVKLVISVVLGLAAVVGPAVYMLGMMAGGLAMVGTAMSALIPIAISLGAALLPLLPYIAAIGAIAGVGQALFGKEGVVWGGSGKNFISDIVNNLTGGLVYGETTPRPSAAGAIMGGGNKSSHEVTIKLDKDLKIGDVNKKEGDAKLNVNSAGYMGQFGY